MHTVPKVDYTIMGYILFTALTMTTCGNVEPASAPSVAENEKAAGNQELIL